MKVYLPQMNDERLESAKEQFNLVFEVTGFGGGVPNECAIATAGLNIILEQLDPIVAAVITMWASNEEANTVTIPMSFKDFHQQVVHLLVRLAFAGGFAEGQVALVEALDFIGGLTADQNDTSDFPFGPLPENPLLN